MAKEKEDLSIPAPKPVESLSKGTWAFSIKFNLDHRLVKVFMLQNKKLFVNQKFDPSKSNNTILLDNGISLVEYHLTESQEKRLMELLSNKDITERFKRSVHKEFKKQSEIRKKKAMLDLSIPVQLFQ